MTNIALEAWIHCPQATNGRSLTPIKTGYQSAESAMRDARAVELEASMRGFMLLSPVSIVNLGNYAFKRIGLLDSETSEGGE